MITVRPADARFLTHMGWLHSRHTFSFSHHYDPAHMGYRALRVINDDDIAAGHGFGMHPHANMEIVSYVTDGELSHKDSMGNSGTIVAGDVQRMSAGTGVFHSEKNSRQDASTHLLQIWLLPKSKDITPSYAQEHFSADSKHNRLRLVASDTPSDGALAIHSDVDLYASLLDENHSVELPLRRGGKGWVQIVKGEVMLSDGTNTAVLTTGDGAAIDSKQLSLMGKAAQTELLVFDLG